MYVYIYIHIHIHIYVYVYVHVHVNVYVHVHVYIYIYTYTYTYIQMHEINLGVQLNFCQKFIKVIFLENYYRPFDLPFYKYVVHNNKLQYFH
jgi:hypothetical protein